VSRNAFSTRCQGFSHLEKQKPCQDASLCQDYDDYSLAVVCDGHGGSDYIRSEIGSKLATEAFVEAINEFMQSRDQFESTLCANYNSVLRQLEKSIIAKWREKISADVSSNPFTQDELASISDKAQNKYRLGDYAGAYGTTLIGIVVTKDYWFGMHQGDGKCVAVSKSGEFSQPIPWDERCYENITTSLCDNDAAKSFRHFFSNELPAAIFVATDGVDDSYSNALDMYSFYKRRVVAFTDKSFDEAVEEMNQFIPNLSKIGSGDDISVAGVIDVDTCSQLKDTFLHEIATREQQLAEEKRQHDLKYIEWLKQFPKKYAEWISAHPEYADAKDDTEPVTSDSADEDAGESIIDTDIVSDAPDAYEDIESAVESNGASMTDVLNPTESSDEQMAEDGNSDWDPFINS